MEQKANLASTTLGSSYTAGAGSISVASATGFPTAAGTFCVTIRDQSTLVVKLIFRVTSVSGTTFTGAAEGTDANAASGDLVDGTMLTVAAVDQILGDWNGYGTFANLPATTGRKTGMRYKCSDCEYDFVFDGTVWVPTVAGTPVTRPDISTFTNHGSAPDSSDNTHGPFHMQFKNGGAGYKWVEYTQALPTGGTGYTITLGFRVVNSKFTGDQIYAGILLRKASSGQFWANGCGEDESSDVVISFTNNTTFLNDPRHQRNDYWQRTSIHYCRVVDDGTNWTYYLGHGGAVDPRAVSNTNWLQVFQQAHNTTFTPDECGFGMSSHNDSAVIQTMEVVHFSATSP